MAFFDFGNNAHFKVYPSVTSTLGKIVLEFDEDVLEIGDMREGRLSLTVCFDGLNNKTKAYFPGKVEEEMGLHVTENMTLSVSIFDKLLISICTARVFNRIEEPQPDDCVLGCPQELQFNDECED